jgi:uncharacterized protein (DUF302 family)
MGTRLTIGPSPLDFSQTTTRLIQIIQRRGLRLFARIDHAAAAHDVGLELPGEEVLIFGNPKAGTSLMQQDPRIGIELPLRILVWVQNRQTMIGYHDPRGLALDYDTAHQEQALAQMARLLEELVSEAIDSEPVSETADQDAETGPSESAAPSM